MNELLLIAIGIAIGTFIGIAIGVGMREESHEKLYALREIDEVLLHEAWNEIDRLHTMIRIQNYLLDTYEDEDERSNT